MWKLIISEIEYFKWLYILSIIFVLIVNFGLTIDGRWIEAQSDFPGLRIIWLGVGIVILFFALLFNRKSGRLRNKILIPLSNNKISIARLIPFIVFWIILSIILVLFYLLNLSSLPSNEWIVNLLSLTGLILMIDSIPILYTDFYNRYFSKRSRILLGVFWSLLWITYIILNTIFATYFDFLSPQLFANSRTVLTELYFSNTATIINISIGVIFFFGSIITFQKRRLYLE